MKADLVVKGGWVVTTQETFKGGVAISDGKFVAIGTDDSLPDCKEYIDTRDKYILPGLIDVHAHCRAPVKTYKAAFGTGSTAAACGGITTLIDMPHTTHPTAHAEQVTVKQR